MDKRKLKSRPLIVSIVLVIVFAVIAVIVKIFGGGKKSK